MLVLDNGEYKDVELIETVDMEPVPTEPTIEERLQAAEDALLFLMERI